MKSRHILTAVAAIGLIAGGQALAQGRGGGQGGGHGGGHGGPVAGGHGGGHGGGIGVGLGRADAGGIDRQQMETNYGRENREQARSNSRAREHANERALERANENSVLNEGTTTAPDLSELETGLSVYDSDGELLGTVRRIARSRDGTVRNVLVSGADGQRRVIRVSPGTLTLDDGVVRVTDDD